MELKYYSWRFGNFFGWLFGFAALAPLHRLVLNLSLHGLGYDNARHSGEEWFIRRVLKKEGPQVCLDIGANIGNYSKLLTDALPAKIYAVEPASSSFKALQQNFSSNDRVTLVNAAISDHEGTATLYAREALSEKATLNLRGNEKTAGEEVRITTVDALVKELGLSRVNFIKIDTEGHERQVLAGMQETLQAFRPAYIQFEFNHVHLFAGTTLYDLAQLLPGYKLYRLLPHGWLPIDPARMASNIFMFSNIVAKRS